MIVVDQIFGLLMFINFMEIYEKNLNDRKNYAIL